MVSVTADMVRGRLNLTAEDADDSVVNELVQDASSPVEKTTNLPSGSNPGDVKWCMRIQGVNESTLYVWPVSFMHDN